MSSIWMESSSQGWNPSPVAHGYRLPPSGLYFFRFGRGSENGVALLAPRTVSVRVNGCPVVAGLRVLEHKDEILVGRTRLFFSAESTPVAVAFQPEAGVRSPTCPNCRGPIKTGERAVQCPGCARWYHQIEPADGGRAKRCWTHSETCRFCNHPTSLTGAQTWCPEQEENHA